MRYENSQGFTRTLISSISHSGRSRCVVQLFGNQCGRSPVQFLGASIDLGEFFRDTAQLREVGPSSMPRPSRVPSAVPGQVHHRNPGRLPGPALAVVFNRKDNQTYEAS